MVNVDVLIVGGGLIGTSLLLALQANNVNALLLDAPSNKTISNAPLDARSLALAPASIRILANLNIWPMIANQATDIHTIHVSEQGRFGHLRLDKGPEDRLGAVVELNILYQALNAKITPSLYINPAKLYALDLTTRVATVQTLGETLKICAKIVVAADGSDSSLRDLCGASAHSKIYPTCALVANLGLARHHNHYAYERFTPQGPIALLPMTGRRAAMVWSLDPEQAKWLAQAPEKVFLNQVQCAFGYRMGRFIQSGQRQVYPLKQIIMSQTVYSGVVFIGNAAHTLNPIAGQGLNLGLRDVGMLAQCLVQYGINDHALDQYQQARESDQVNMIKWTDRLLSLFDKKIPGAGIARGLGLIALDNLPGLKKGLIQQASGFSGLACDLVCGIQLAALT